MGATRAARVLVAVGLVAALATGCGGRLSSAQVVQLPAFPPGCHASFPPTGAQPRLPVQVVRWGHGSAWLVAGVCIDGHGPYPFVVDTGAAVTAVDTGLADELGLPDRTSSRPTTSFGCRTSESAAVLRSWSAGGVSLDPQVALVATLRSPRVPGLRGLIGSDVLSRFGAARFDFDRGAVTLGGAEGPPETAQRTGGHALPPALRAGTSASVAINVQASLGARLGGVQAAEVQATVPVWVGDGRWPFVVDTGASETVVKPQVARSANLGPPLATGYTYAGLACRTAVTEYHLSSWHLDGVSLPAQRVGSNVLDGGIVGGLLGSGTLQNFSPVVVDYAGGHLLLGPHHTPSFSAGTP